MEKLLLQEKAMTDIMHALIAYILLLITWDIFFKKHIFNDSYDNVILRGERIISIENFVMLTYKSSLFIIVYSTLIFIGIL